MAKQTKGLEEEEEECGGTNIGDGRLYSTKDGHRLELWGVLFGAVKLPVTEHKQNWLRQSDNVSPFSAV